MTLRALNAGLLLVTLVSLVGVVSYHGAELDAIGRRAWSTLLIRQGILVVATGLVELVWHVTRLGEGVLYPYRFQLYHVAYLLPAVANGVLPLVLLIQHRRARLDCIFPVAALGGITLVTVLGLARGLVTEWQVLLGTTQVLTLIGLAGFLYFCAMAVLGRLQGASRHLVLFVAFLTLFYLLLPIQEEVFRQLGIAGAKEVWTANLVAQVLVNGAQAVVVVAFLRSVRRGSPTPMLVDVS